LLYSCASGIRIGSTAPSFSADATDGGVVALDDFRNKVVVLYFWATWCLPCVEVSSYMQDLHDTYHAGGKVKVLAIHYNNIGDPKEYCEEHGYTFTLVPDGISVAKAYRVTKIPTLIIIGTNGSVIYKQVGLNRELVDEAATIVERHLETMQPDPVDLSS
jgi:peroxiredoxin